jgi:hypothetical protein
MKCSSFSFLTVMRRRRIEWWEYHMEVLSLLGTRKRGFEIVWRSDDSCVVDASETCARRSVLNTEQSFFRTDITTPKRNL